LGCTLPVLERLSDETLITTEHLVRAGRRRTHCQTIGKTLVYFLTFELSRTIANLSAGSFEARGGDASIVDLSLGDVAELAGYGITEEGTVGGLRFLTEAITALDPATITVAGFGATGACEGDSGGPLLVRGRDGSPRVVGVLTVGSASCTGADDYVRLDAVQGWMQATIGSGAPDDADCGTIPSQQGRCLYGTAVWCSGMQLLAEHCMAGKECGWDGSQAGFRCVDSQSDPCDGVDSVGGCRDGAALSCRGGTLVRQTCAPCGTCRVDGTTGSPGCEARPPAEE
jgi:hypothetical protein